MTCVVNFVLPSHSSKVLSGDGLVGGNPTTNTPRLRRGGGIASSSFVNFFYLYWYSYIVYFVCDSASEFGAMGSTSSLGFSYPNLLLVFSEPVIFRNLYNKCWDFLSLDLFYFIFILFFCTLFWVSL